MMVNDGFSVTELTYSPIKGGQGNIEFLAVLTRDDKPKIADKIDIDALLMQTYAQLNHTGSNEHE